MIKEIISTQLLVGMYIHKLHCKWIDHPFAKSQFLIDSEDDVKKIIKAKIKRTSIDTSKGLDVATFEIADKPIKPHVAVSEPESEQSQVSLEIRVKQAKNLVGKASKVVINIMSEVRAGNKIDLDVCGQVVSSISRMLSKDSHTLLGVARLKTKDEYTFIHSVSVSALLASFASSLGYNSKEVDQIALGGLLHDVGKALTPNKILNKPGKLTDDEFIIMRQHAVDPTNILLAEYDLPQLALDVITMHHERPDGRGYPLGLKNDQISEVGKMSAIVDIYDALTSVRVYKDAWEPTDTLKNMLNWCPNQLDRPLMEKFIKTLGIYPVGSLVELESGKVGLVVEQTENLLRPVLKVIFDAKLNSYTIVHELNLLIESDEKIVQTIAPTKYKIRLASFI